MFLPTHLLVGTLLDKVSSGWRKWLLVPPLALASHFLLDFFNCGVFTLYHGPFSPTATAVVIGASIVMTLTILIWMHQHWWGMLWAALPDLEWVIFGALHKTAILHYQWLPILAQWPGVLVQFVVGIMLLVLLFRSRGS